MKKMIIACMIAIGALILLVWALSACKPIAILGGPPPGPCGWGVVYDDAGDCCDTAHGYTVTQYGKCEADIENPAPDDISAKRRRLDSGHD